MPDSFCYQSDIAKCYPVLIQRYQYTFGYTTDWLLRHMVWEESRKYLSKGIWLGPQEGELEPKDYIEVLNPTGLCRCRGGKTYGECHLPTDLQDEKRSMEKKINNKILTATHMRDKFLKICNWNKFRKMPQEIFYNELQRKLKA